MHYPRISIPLITLLFPAILPAQPRVPLQSQRERVIAIVPMTGAGTPDDPRRPLFAPTFKLPPRADLNAKLDPAQLESLANGIIEYSYELSDDGRFAIAVFAARDLRGLAPLLSSQRADVKVFRKGKHTKEEIETELRKIKRDFDANAFDGLRDSRAKEASR